MSYDCGTITISSGVATSAALPADPHYKRAAGLLVAAPATLTQANATVQVSHDGGTTYNNLQSGGSDITLAQGDSAMITQLGFTHLRLNTTAGNEGADRAFTIRGIERPF